VADTDATARKAVTALLAWICETPNVGGLIVPELADIREERFAQAMSRDFDLAEAYSYAGYREQSGRKEKAEQLLTNPDIVARIAVLRETAPVLVRPQNWVIADALEEEEIVAEAPTAESAYRELEQARRLALKRGQPAAAVSAAIAKAKIAGLLAEKPESPPEPCKPESPVERPVTFDGNYNEAARRVALLLRLGEYEPSEGGNR
jgi:hypothetical protein